MTTLAIKSAIKALRDGDMEHAFSVLEAAAHAGDSEAQFEVGKAYAATLAFYKSAIYQQYAPELVPAAPQLKQLANLAVDFLTRASHQQGIACHYLGHLYQNGLGVPKDIEQARWYYEQAIALDYGFSLQRLGYFLEMGIDEPKNIIRAIECYESVVALGLLPPQKSKTLNWGLSKSTNKSTATVKPQKYQSTSYNQAEIGRALNYFVGHVENGLIAALTNLGLIYLTGNDVARDQVKALEYLHQAANLGGAEAQATLANLYQNGSGVTQDYAMAVSFYKQAAAQGHAISQTNLGYLYQNGLGVEQDEKIAKHYYEHAALAGYAPAQVRLGYCFYQGIGTEVDFAKAAFFFEKAAQQNHPMGCKNLGMMYDQGHGVDKDPERAKQLLAKADELIN